MKENKNIDDLFRQKVRATEEMPPSDVWEKIDARLSQNRKRRPLVIPLWYKIAGAAAVLLLIFTLFSEQNEPALNPPSITNLPETQDITIESNQEKIDPKATPAPKKPYNNKRTIVTKADHKASDSNINSSSTNAYSQNGSKENREEIEQLQIYFNTKEREGFSFHIPAKNFTSGHPDTRISTLKEMEELTEKAEDPEEEIFKTEPLRDRFSLTPTIAAVYFGKMGGGNALDQRFSDNSNPGEISVSYGLSLTYQITPKIRIRSGLNSVNLSSQTQDVENSLAGNASAIEGNPAGNINFGGGYGTLNQQLNFLEIPLEMEYILIDKEIGVSIIAGASTFILQENEVLLNSNSFNGSLGPANNLNQTSFSANLGIGLSYKLFSHFEFNLNPIFKYQLNTYEDVSNLKPYHFGIYSGIRFKF